MKKIPLCNPVLTGILLFQISTTYAATKVYTSDADFVLGIMNGIVHDISDQLQLSEKQTTLPFIWIANSGESTVSKIETSTGCELGRYRTGPGSENPSRTTVDLNGDLWVGNRNSNTATKIALYPTDSNDDGVVTTSQDLNENCVIEPSEVLPWGDDEAILLRIGVDIGPRALAVDTNNNVWIGGYGKNMGYYDGETGEMLKNIFVGYNCYGALIDSHGTLWISGRPYGLIRIDNPDYNHTITPILAHNIYGMGIDQEGYIYSAAYSSNRLRKYDPVNKEWVYDISIPGGSYGRGVAVGFDGDVWVAHSGSDVVTRHNPATGNVEATIPVGKKPTGVATAADGKIWVTNYNSHNVMRIDPETNAVDFTHGPHPYPYNYSDMTGMVSRSVTTKKGTWTIVYDEGEPSVYAATVSWTDFLPADSTIIVKVRSSKDGIVWGGFKQVQSGVEFLTLERAAYLEIMVDFTASTEDKLSPILYDLTVNTAYACDEFVCVHDEGLNDSQFFTIDQDLIVEALGDIHEKYDIEALDIHPKTKEIYAASGDNTDKKGHLYKVDKENGTLTDLGPTICKEVDGLSFHPNGMLWGWGQDCGLFVIDVNNGDIQMIIESNGEIEVEDLSWNVDGTVLYGVENIHNDHHPDNHPPFNPHFDPDDGLRLWSYDYNSQKISPVCEDLMNSLELEEVEAMDTLPNDTLIFGFHGNVNLSIGVLDVQNCQIVAAQGITTDYNDVEGVAWSWSICKE